MAKNHNHVQVILKRKLVVPKFLRVTPVGDDFSAEKEFPGELPDNKDSFKNSVKFLFLLGQIICLIPVMEEFDWDSYKIYANFAVIVGQLIIALLSAVWMYREFRIHKIGYVLFFFGAAVMMVLMIRLMYMWPKLLKKWREIEFIFGYQKGLKNTFAFISVIIVSFSIVEYLSNLIVNLATTSQHTSKVLKSYSINMFPQVFGVVSYTIWKALPIIYINTVSTLIYTFGDLIVFSISLALSNYFKLYNAQVFALKHQNLTLKEWKQLRYRYMKLCELVYEVDDCLCHLLCLTFLMHLYILCVEINQGMLYITDTNEKIHKIVTFTISMLRACALCYSTVSVHEQSKHISTVIHSSPTSSYCLEIVVYLYLVKTPSGFSLSLITCGGIFNL